MTRTIQEQLNDASRHLAAVTRDMGFNHPYRRSVLEVVRELQKERSRREDAERKAAEFAAYGSPYST